MLYADSFERKTRQIYGGGTINQCALTEDGQESNQIMGPVESAAVVFGSCVAILIWFSHMDISTRRIPNHQLLVSFIVATVIVIFSGHLFAYPMLHGVAVGFTGLMGYVLYRLGSIGGGDLKLILIVAFLSPGMVFTTGGDPILEVVITSGLMTLGMLLLGWFYSRNSRANNDASEDPMTPLIPFLTISYMILQGIGIMLHFWS